MTPEKAPWFAGGRPGPLNPARAWEEQAAFSQLETGLDGDGLGGSSGPKAESRRRGHGTDPGRSVMRRAPASSRSRLGFGTQGCGYTPIPMLVDSPRVEPRRWEGYGRGGRDSPESSGSLRATRWRPESAVGPALGHSSTSISKTRRMSWARPSSASMWKWHAWTPGSWPADWIPFPACVEGSAGTSATGCPGRTGLSNSGGTPSQAG